MTIKRFNMSQSGKQETLGLNPCSFFWCSLSRLISDNCQFESQSTSCLYPSRPPCWAPVDQICWHHSSRPVLTVWGTESGPLRLRSGSPVCRTEHTPDQVCVSLVSPSLNPADHDCSDPRREHLHLVEKNKKKNMGKIIEGINFGSILNRLEKQ